MQLARYERLVLEVGTVRLLINIEQTRQINRALGKKDLPGIEGEIAAQAFDNFGIGIHVDLEAHGRSLAAIVQFGAH